MPIEDKEEALEVHKVTLETKGQSKTHESTDTVEPHPRGHSNINGLIKALGTRNKYKGGWDEDLAGTIEVYELTCVMCNITGAGRLADIPVMLDSGSLSYYATNIRNVSKTYDDAITMLKEWFTSEEQMTRLLQQWREITLSAWFRKYPDKSQSDVFRLLCEKLTSIQRQLHSDYRNPRFLRDQLIAAADIPNVRRALKEHVPKTAHDAIQKIASLLSSEPASAGNTVDGDSSTFYGLKTSYGGGAERSTGNYWKPRYKRNPGKKKMAKVKDFWVCRANHFARRFHSKQKVANALEKLKNDRAYVTAEDVAAIFLSVSDSESDSSSDDSIEEDEVNFMSNDVIDETNIAIEETLSNRTFLHSCGFFTYRDEQMRAMEKDLRKNDRRQEFNGIIIDIGANRTSMMSLDQYIAYCREHNVPARIADFNRSVRGIGGVCVKTIGKATVAVPFTDIGVVCDITFHITEGHNPTLLSLRDLKNIGLELSIQKNCVHMMGKSQKLVHENDFLYYRWKPDLHLYTYGELKKLHRSFGHPTVSALQKMLKPSRPAEMTNEVKQAVQEIVNNCQTCNELASKPMRFRLSIGAENSRFNHVILADIMYIDQKPVLHVIDEATHFSSATFLPRVTSKDVWKALLRTWIYTYMGPPDHLKIDQGSNFVSKEFKGSASVLGINLIEAPVESPASMSVVD